MFEDTIAQVDLSLKYAGTYAQQTILRKLGLVRSTLMQVKLLLHVFSRKVRAPTNLLYYHHLYTNTVIEVLEPSL